MRRSSEDARVLALYLVTCPHRTAEGLFSMRLAYAAADLQWLPERLTEPLAELVEIGFIGWEPDDEVMLLRSALKYQTPANPNMVKAAMKKIDGLPVTPLTWEFERLAERFCKPLAEQVRNRFGNKPPTVYETSSSISSSSSKTLTPVDESTGGVCAEAKATETKQPRFDSAAWETWWDRYPKKKGKKAALAAYKRALKLTTADQLAEGLDRSIAMWRTIEIQFVPYPTTWLNQGRWDDEPDTATLEAMSTVRDTPLSDDDLDAIVFGNKGW